MTYPPTKTAHHSGRRFMLVKGIGVLPTTKPEVTIDVGPRALKCPCGQDVLTAEARPVCPSCKKDLPALLPGAKGWAVP
ncbi:MAG TPA: hypothetical protein PLU79_22105 [Burkholderiaceae bacterium]|nr:hypothetical protein [Burkholderiaceae bacterium]